MSDPYDPTNDDFSDLEQLLREVSAEDHDRVAPPAAVWAGIEAALVAESVDDTMPDVLTPADIVATPQSPEVVELERRRRRVPRLIAGAAAAVAIVAAGIVALNVGDDEPIVVASAELEHLPDFDPAGADAAAHVSLVDDEGVLRIAVDESDLPTPADEPADLELWLIQPDETGAVADLVSLGLVDPDDPGSYDVPAGLDPTEFRVVDISVEPRDGDETHSGRSILRAPLDFA